MCHLTNHAMLQRPNLDTTMHHEQGVLTASRSILITDAAPPKPAHPLLPLL